MLRLLATAFFVALCVEAVVPRAGTNPCSVGALVYTRNSKCECRRHNGAMGNFRAGCSATPGLGVCTTSCDADENEQNLLGPEAAQVCPLGTHACPVGKHEFECVSPDMDIDNCGGCASTGEGLACGDYPGVRGAACVYGTCDVYSCSLGYTLSDGECVRRAARKRQ
ncbi:hypothetical protein B0H15DRAFT_817343 [Mycena belliarum]|uniref:Protein CPL1-like domain-containing protein n=1 Tax=Mycena belliarum TaxID=1033014 RepID=A0AAD6UJ38_9AGAR|nr:hypothetical protein B0H15DRAFT_817343 [Mycena belliae]